LYVRPRIHIYRDAKPREPGRGGRRGLGGLGRSGVGTSLILLSFVMLPSAVLGYLSWRAIEGEKSDSLERLRGSYRQFAALAARQMDYQLRVVESRWIAELDGLLSASAAGPTPGQVAAATGREPLVSEYFLLAAPDRLLHPRVPEGGESAARDPALQAPEGPEHDLFVRLAARGEDLEYRADDLAGAMAAYREILSRVQSPRLRAMAESYVGRAQLKAGDASGALITFRRLLTRYPEARDLNRMYLRFLAQYEIAAALESLRRYPQALDALLELNRDLVRRSDAITTMQYSYFSDLIQTLAPQLFGEIAPGGRGAYVQAFRALGEQNKKRISEKYFTHLLATELSDMSFRRKHYTPRTQYLSARAEGEPFLLAYRTVPDTRGTYVTGILAAQIDLGELQRRLLVAVQTLAPDSGATVALLGAGGGVVIGADGAKGALVATEDLMPPFDFWQVGVYLHDVPTAMHRLDLRRTLWHWLVSLMLISILFGGYAFIVRVRRQAYLSRAQTTFVSNVTHELRTPLASIKLFAELLDLRMNEAPADAPARDAGESRRYLGLLRQECDRLTRLIDRVLDFSRMERRARRYRFEAQDVGEVVARSVESFRPQAEAAGFRLTLALEPPLPSLLVDADAIAQVILNLLTNALQYSQDEKEIRVRVGREGAAVAVEVSDRGIGIEPGDLDRVFDKFYSAWRRMDSRVQGGLGLGLALSREIVRAHGGQIGVRSEVGRGSTFTVLLPAPAAADAPEARMQAAGEARLFERLGDLSG
jgi:signal transduction histidine kinase